MGNRGKSDGPLICLKEEKNVSNLETKISVVSYFLFDISKRMASPSEKLNPFTPKPKSASLITFIGHPNIIN